jgi:DDE superfamily endonuclease
VSEQKPQKKVSKLSSGSYLNIELSIPFDSCCMCWSQWICSPSIFVVPGQHLSWDMVDGCDMFGTSVTVAPKGFINACLFEKWLSHYDSVVPETTKRPLILVYDGYSSNFNEDIVTKARSLSIILVLLPSNATHLV